MTLWDAIVIGAGPAGSMAAAQLARANKSVLLIDKSNFPRGKVCGCCLNLAAIDALEEAGLQEILQGKGAHPLASIKLFEGNRQAEMRLPGGVAISRNYLDMLLVEAAMQRGANFMPGHSVKVLRFDEEAVLIRAEARWQSIELRAKIIVVADGISGHCLDLHPQFAVKVSQNSRFGAGAVVSSVPDFYKAGHIYMACGSGGYVGLVLLEDGQLDVAAALDRQFSRRFKGPANAAIEILFAANLPVPTALENARWAGTEALTRKRLAVAGQRVFVVGDACGYVEPFTGEGIAWALWTGMAVARIAEKGMGAWDDALITEWQSLHSSLLQHRHARTNVIASALRNGALRHFGLMFLSSMPALAEPLLSEISGHSLRMDYRARALAG